MRQYRLIALCFFLFVGFESFGQTLAFKTSSVSFIEKMPKTNGANGPIL